MPPPLHEPSADMAVETPTPSSISELGLAKTELVYFGNEFPNGLQEIVRRLSNHAKDRHYQVLAELIANATLVVKDEIRQLPTDLKELFSPFTSILSWVDDVQLREGRLCGSVDGALLVVVQLAAYIGYLVTNPDELHNFEEMSLAGLGVGLLASTAVSLSWTLADLPLAGADAVRLAFRMGVLVASVSETLDCRDLSQAPDTWAYVVLNVSPVDAQRELDAIQPQQHVPSASKVFISAISPTSITISGPPAKLKTLLKESEFYRVSKFVPLPVYGGLCHAPHVYGLQHVTSIVHGSSLNMLRKDSWPIVPVYSTSTGLPYAAKNAAELFECVVMELLTKPICWDQVIRGMVDRLKGTGTAAVALYCFGNSTPLNALSTSLTSEVKGLQASINSLLPWITQRVPSDTTPRDTSQSKLAIVGMSCRLPGGADSTEKFWKVLEDGLDVSRRIPPDRFDVDSHYDPTGSGKELNKSMTQYGCFIDEPGLFDAPFFNMSPRESLVVDPQMRLALVTAYEALEQSGFVLNRTPSTQSQRIGTYYGQAADDYREVNQGQRVSTYYIPGGCRAFGPGRINYFFKFAGPSYSIDTACSSGLAAIEVACQALWNGDIDTAVAGGVNVLTNPDGFAGLSHGHFLTKGHNACKTWDITADGYCRADGIGSVVIKRYEEAIADNDAILGVILGAGTNHSADAVSITHPHAGHQAYLSRQVLRQAGVNPLDVSYIELHGTGTQAGDLQEMQAVTDVYAPSVGGRNSGQPLYIGAVKSNIGHGESVAGTAALIKVLMMLQKNAIPPHVGIKTEINPKLPKDLGTRNVHIPHKLTPWPRAPGKKRMVAINNFGAAGGNTTLVLEEAPTRHITETDPRQTHVVSVSAKTKVSLAANIENLLEYLDANPETSLADLSYTTTARRYHHSLRVASASSSIVNLRKQLMGHLEKVNSTRPSAKSDSPPIAFAFTGQGASLKSMDLELYRDATSFREHIQYLDSLAQAQGYPSFIPALDGSHPPDYKQPPVITQLALVCTEISLAKYWSTLGIKPDVVMGHSLGEFAAMNVAGVTSASETIFMVGRRAELLQEQCTRGSHCMMAVRASVARISECAAGKPYTVACINSASDTVLSGTQKQINDVAMLLEAAGLKCIRLDVSFAFHSDQVNPVLDEFENAVKLGVTFQEPKLPIISPLLGKVIFDGKTLNANYVRRATREAVDFLAALENAQRVATIDDETLWLEIGPHPVCTGFIKTIIPSTQLALPSICRGSDNWQTVAESLAALHLAGVKVGWNEFHRPFEGRLRLLDLPAYVWNNKNYWVQYNGDWCLTKGNSFYGSQQKASRAPQTSEIQTSTVQQIWEESFNGVAGTVTIQSDLMQPDFCAAADGHRLNNCGVVTSSIHADIAYTLGGYLHKKLCPQTNSISMDITNLAVTKGLVANSTKSSPQLIRVTATTADVYNGVDLYWQSVGNDCTVHDSFASARIVYGDANKWLCSWSPIAHLIVDRIETLERLASVGKANRFSRNMAYTLFASNLVDYADKYRGMQSVVMHDLEGFADVQLTTKEGGVWTVPPYFIDSVAHLAGFIMNCSDAMDSKKNFCVTPGWKSMRFAKPLVPGAQYRSYVKMIPTVEDPTTYFGDVYILQHNVVVGMVNGIEFHSYPRILLNRFFSPADKITSTEVTPSPPKQAQQTKPTNGCMQSQPTSASSPAAAPVPPSSATPVPVDATTPPAAPPTSSDGIAAKALQLIAHEAGLAVSDLNDDASFVSLGIDSLMSLVIAENLGSELNVKVSGSLFIDYPSIGDLRKWLEEYHS